MFSVVKKVTILVVDDHLPVSTSVSLLIKKLGYDVMTADNGDSALELLKSHKIDAMFLEISIPGEKGLEILSYVNEHLSDLPVIVTSFAMSEKDEADVFKMGAFDYLVNPVNSARLEVTIKKAIIESERRQQASLFSVVITNSPITIVITDKEGNIEFVNNAFCRTTGYSFKEVLGQNPRILNSGEQAESFYKDLWDTITSGKNWHGEFHNKKKNGELYWEYAVIIPIIDPTWSITHFVSIKQDISLRKKEHEALRDSVIIKVPF